MMMAERMPSEKAVMIAAGRTSEKAAKMLADRNV
jgi:hypothetical protein